MTSFESISWAQSFLQLPKVWTRTRGRGVLVAVIDTGIDVDHPDLADAVVDSRDFTGSPTGVGDVHGHGTHVAGIIAARGNDRGVVGVAPDAGLLNAKVLKARGAGIEERHVSEAIRWARESGARVICLSLTSATPTLEVQKAIKEVGAQDPPVIVVAAAGNRGPNPGTIEYPARYPETLAVGSVLLGEDGVPKLAYDSSVGAEVDVVAPGVNVLSTYPPGALASASGTSMAAPFVAGVIALLISRRTGAGQRQPDLEKVRVLIKRTSRDIYPPRRDRYTGWGLLDPEAFLEASQG